MGGWPSEKLDSADGKARVLHKEVLHRTDVLLVHLAPRFILCYPFVYLSKCMPGDSLKGGAFEVFMEENAYTNKEGISC